MGIDAVIGSRCSYISYNWKHQDMAAKGSEKHVVV